MNSFIETLNQRGEIFLSFAWPVFWQSSLLIGVLLALDFLLRRKLRASIRYALWLIVLAKLILPPTLALPTSPVWWLHQPPPVIAKTPKPNYTVTYDQKFSAEIPEQTLPTVVPPKPKLTVSAWLLAISISMSAFLLCWLLVRWWQITRQVRHAKTSERLNGIADAAQTFLGLKMNVAVKLTTNSMSPAVCGLFRPTILIPQSLAENFSDEQLRAVLLHELIHLRRRDVWVNFLQALLQIFYWWHPLVWLANACIRQVREEAVDDAVMLALRDEAESYAPTLLEVAKLALNRPLVSLGLVGIMESRNALRQRIERLLNFRAPKKAGVTFLSCCGIFIFSAVALPMGEKPVANDNSFSTDPNSSEMKSLTVKVNPEIFVRNVKAQANHYLHSPANDYAALLLEIMRSEAVDCSPQHGIAFNTKTGEITMQNLPERLEIFQRVIEQLNRADGICELPLHNNPHRKSVLIEARLYQMSAADFKRIASGLQFYPKTSASDSWSSSPPENFKQLIQTLESSDLQPIQRPRIQTGSGSPADFYVGNATNSVEFECEPFAQEGFIDLKSRVTIIENVLFTNRFNIEASAQTGGGIVIRTENFAGHSESNLVTIINMQVVTNQSGLAPVKKQQNSERPQIHIKARFVEVPKGTPLNLQKIFATTNFITNQFTGVLTELNRKTIFRSLQSREGFETLAEPEVSTTSGQQAQIRTTQTVTVITNFIFQDGRTNGSIIPQTEKVEVGPILDVIPSVLSDNHTINLAVITSLMDFLGYDKSTNITTAYNRAGEKINVPKISPRFLKRQLNATLYLEDGQTVMIGGLAEKTYVSDKEISVEPKSSNKELLIFITATIVDPAGNRIHSDEDLPFAQKGIPSQPPQK